MWIYLGLAVYNFLLGAGAIHLYHKLKSKGNNKWAYFWLAFLPLNFSLIVYNLFKAFMLLNQ